LELGIGYENQSTKEWRSEEEAIAEIRRLLFIYIDLKIQEKKAQKAQGERTVTTSAKARQEKSFTIT